MHTSAKERRELCLFKAWEDSELLSALADPRTLLVKNPLENALTIVYKGENNILEGENYYTGSIFSKF